MSHTPGLERLGDSSLVITGATGQVGSALVRALVGLGARPTALVRRDMSVEGCLTIPNWLISERAIAAIKGADVVVHLAGALNPPDHNYVAANVVPTQRIVEGIDAHRTHRLIFLSYVGASERSANQYLSTKGRAERMLEETGVPLTTLRSTHIIGPPLHPGPTAAGFISKGMDGVKVLGSGRQRVAPVFIADVVAAIRTAMTSGQTGTFGLQGPDVMSFDNFVKLLNQRVGVSIKHIRLPFAYLLQYIGPKLPRALIEVMAHDSVSDLPRATAEFRLPVTHLDRVWLADDKS